ncbi:cell division protein FtsZ [Bergeyella cardium]|uniref:Cell division protein FtsZ n=1 Tax=Bergeyella cardium TaxID=1585976 RepID=A0A6P1QVW4_9FLAO|nr:cell division protein FtsZ [Bergeyella cardium]QHN64971.1 cell division protein FtsZ [Bergeyella cardium]WHE34283.1 cell division protein FtsZ [Bergeyella cardium]WHF60934.1 cell division protein FtsZ [Bergeyella cardium]
MKELSFNMEKGKSSIIKVIGVGGAGNNALKHMYERGIHGVDFVICNTDQQVLHKNPVENKIQLGLTTTEGLGAGADPEEGEKAALESIDDIKAMLGQNTKMVFITAGMGGGTGTGAAPVIAKVAKDMGILTVAIVTIPFSFEGEIRLTQAEQGLEKLRESVDSLIVINNERLLQLFPKLGFLSGFARADEILSNAVKGMAEVITAPLVVNIDFRDAKSVLENSGTALISTGSAIGENRAEEAIKKALDSPLLNDNKITGAKDVLLLILSGNEENQEATMEEIGFINRYIQEEAGGNNKANIIFGVGTDQQLGDEIKVLVIATGFNKDNQKKIQIGESEKVTFKLDDNAPKKESPFKTREQRTQEESLPSDKNIFRLDDDEGPVFEPTPQFSAASSPAISSQTLVIEEEVPVQVGFFGNDDSDSKSEINLFSDFDEYESSAFSFEVENHKETFPSHEEKPVEVSFTLNKEEIAPQYEVKKKISTEVEQEVKPSHTFSPQEGIQEVPQNKSEEVKEGFIFITKESEEHKQKKVQERRNRLQQFNYYRADSSAEAENEFETVPAFRRKNISIDEAPSTEEQNSFFISEDNKGEAQIRQNSFLNKDVD